MSIAQTETTLSDRAESPVRTRTTGDEELAGSSEEESRNRDAWQRAIDHYLVEWGRDPSQLEDDDFVPPSLEIIRLAIDVAKEAQNAVPPAPAPLRVVPDGEGGIVFERRAGDVFESLEIQADGSIQVDTFRDCRLEGTAVLRVI
jgi:hypothetical protein